jgi:hypothetical protein
VGYLVPVTLVAAPARHAAIVFVRDGASNMLEEFATDLTADASILGVSFFQLADHAGETLPDLSYIDNACGSTGCLSRIVVLRWDGTAWRDIGPGPGQTIQNLDSIRWEGAGSESQIVVHGGELASDAPTEAGPGRASTTTFKLVNGRFAVANVEKDSPTYLFQAVEDADDAFARDIAASEALYRAIVEDKDLKDWKLKPDAADRRPALIGYALYRIALIQAATGRDPSSALDTVITESKEPLFAYLAEAFRTGYQERGGVVGGCAAVNLYLKTPQAGGADPTAYIAQLFNFGYTNLPGSSWVPKMCPF